MFTIIAAVDQCKGIGYNGKMPWHLPEELAFFKEKTLYRKIAMGKRTYQGLEKPLEKRINIVFSHSVNHYDTTVLWHHNIDRFITDYKDCDEEIFITGGAHIYKKFLPYVSKMYISVLDREYRVDTYFPDFDETLFTKELIKQGKEFNVYLYERIDLDEI